VSVVRYLAACALALALAASLTSCGARGHDEVVVRVGDAPISKATLDHWTSLMRPALALSHSSAQPDGGRGSRDQALAFLIAAKWLIGEGAEQELRLSDREVERRIEAGEKSGFPGGEAELRAFMKATGHTRADLALRVKAELASAELRQKTLQGVPRVTRVDVARYYRSHRGRYAFPEAREVRITNRKSAREAVIVMRQIKSGKRFRALLQPERWQLPGKVDARHPREPLPQSIRAARLDVPTGPVRQGPDYFVFEVKRIVPAGYSTLAQVEETVRRRLEDERKQRALAMFVSALEARWVARTSCRPGYVVQKCGQYTGPRAPEDPFNLD